MKNITITQNLGTSYEPLYPTINNSKIAISATQITSGILPVNRGGTGTSSISNLKIAATQINSGILPIERGGTGTNSLEDLRSQLGGEAVKVDTFQVYWQQSGKPTSFTLSQPCDYIETSYSTKNFRIIAGSEATITSTSEGGLVLNFEIDGIHVSLESYNYFANIITLGCMSFKY